MARSGESLSGGSKAKLEALARHWLRLVSGRRWQSEVGEPPASPPVAPTAVSPPEPSPPPAAI